MSATDDGQPTVSRELLLRYETATDVCLSCHARGGGGVLSPDPSSPSLERGGGDFAFLLEDNLDDTPGGTLTPIGGHQAGHNVISIAWGISADPVNTVAPGGTYPASQLGCTSCHDPHGNTNVRLLWGAGQEAPGGFVFTYPAPQGVAPALGTRPESQSHHTAYQSGWTEWCANCHDLYHDRIAQGFKHPVNQAIGGLSADEYSRYEGEANPVAGNPAVAYRPEVPFADPTITTSSTLGPVASSRITCMTCHRAHASSAPYSGRWDFNVLYLDQDGSSSGSYAIPNPYPGAGQRSLCIQCHVSYTRDHGLDQPCIECHRQLDSLSQPLSQPPPPLP
jgi:predicted CXXCH cytochrome family protein